MRLAIGAVAALLLTTNTAGAQDLWPGTTYDTAIPTIKSVLGHDFGEEVSAPEEITSYLKALAAAAPDRTRLIEYARTWEGRPLHVVAIASPARISRLDQIKADLKRLADPRTVSSTEESRLLGDLPVVTWLMHGVHGNEISSGDAALAEAYHLLAARGDAMVDTILRESIVLIDPLENPDGRSRFLFQHKLGRAAIPDGERLSAEHDEPWPGGRSNHYLFDMNRDWFAQTQPETRGRLKVALDFFPHVVVDLHEMGGDSTYYFAPPADPLNPFITPDQIRWLETFGRANAARFDDRGFAYFIREVYDSFYPGYGESWPIFNGAIGMTYEQASARGLVFTREDDTTLTYRQGVVHHFNAAITTAYTAASNRERLLRDFLRIPPLGHRRGREGRPRASTCCCRATTRPWRAGWPGIWQRKASTCVWRARRSRSARARCRPARISSRRRSRRAGWCATCSTCTSPSRRPSSRNRIAGARSGWAIRSTTSPAGACRRCSTSRSSPARRRSRQGPHPWPRRPPGVGSALPPAKVAYFCHGAADAGRGRTSYSALACGCTRRAAASPSATKTYPAGTAIVRVAELGDGQREALARIVARHGVPVVALDSGWVDRGVSLGSGDVAALKVPRIVLAWDAPTSSLSAGWTRYVLERRFGFAVSAVRVSSLGRLDLGKVDVLVLPQGAYSNAFNDEAVRRLREWMRGGGTLVTLGEASRWAASEKVSLLDTRAELRGGKPDIEEKDKDKKPADPPQPFDYDKAVQPERERPENIPGAVVRVRLDLEHWLASGTDGEIQAIVEGQRVFTPLKLDKGTNVGTYFAKDRLVVGGLAWDEAQSQLAQKAFLMHQAVGQGHIIAFAEEPNYRAFTEATQLLFANAVLLGVAY